MPRLRSKQLPEITPLNINSNSDRDLKSICDIEEASDTDPSFENKINESPNTGATVKVKAEDLKVQLDDWIPTQANEEIPSSARSQFDFPLD